MPGGSKYEGPPDALDSYRSVVEGGQSDADVKGAKNPYTSRNGHMFSFLAPDGTMALRLSDEMTEEFRSSHESGDVIHSRSGSTGRGSGSAPCPPNPPTRSSGWEQSSQSTERSRGIEPRLL